MKGGISGALSGGIFAGLSTSIPSSLYEGQSNSFTKFAGETIYNGVKNKINNKKFLDGFDVSLLSFGSSKLYSQIVQYDPTYEPGGPAVEKGINQMPVKGYSLILKTKLNYLKITIKKYYLKSK